MKKLFLLMIAVIFISQSGVIAMAQGRVDHKLNPNGPPDAVPGIGAGVSGELNGHPGQGKPTPKPTPSASPTPLATGGTAAVSALINHGGPVLSQPVIYIIWYGNWNQTNDTDTPLGQQIIRDWAGSIGGSQYFAINASYPPLGSISGTATFGGEYTNTGTSTALTDANIQSIVGNSIGSSGGKLPYDANGVYMVITSSNVNATSGFCTQYCGWHTAGDVTAGHVRYAFVGNAARCINACAAQTTSPNGNAGVDGAISVMSHELEEATTDPDLNAWYDRRGEENADKCAWTFGHAQYRLASGAWANVHLGSRDYLIQRNLWFDGGSGWFCMINSSQD